MTSVAQRKLSLDDYRLFYQRNGYVVLPGQISAPLIDAFLAYFTRDIKASRAKFFRQRSGTYERNRINEHGHVVQSFLDVHHYKRHPDFRQAALDLLFSPALQQGLAQTSGHGRHHLMRSMLFDANPATGPHQDWWHLDSVPHGHLLGVCLALEDIREEAGRFYVLPGSHNVKLHDSGMTHVAWLAKMQAFLDRNRDMVHAPALRKGDVLIWNSRTIHGSLEATDSRFSRKTLTAHFLPSSMTFGNLFTARPWVQYEQYGEYRYFANQPEHSLKAEFVSRLKMVFSDHPKLMRLMRPFQSKSVADV